MGSPISLGDVQSIIKTAKDLYDDYENLNKQIESTMVEVNKLGEWIDSLAKFCKKHAAVINQFRESKQALNKELKDIRTNVGDVVLLIETRDDSQDLSGKFNRIMWWVGSNPSRLLSKRDMINENSKWVKRWIGMLTLEITTSNSGPTSSHGHRPAPGPRYLKVKPRSQSVLVVDMYDEARSVLLTFYSKLLQQWTEGTGGAWPLSIVDSAGSRVQGSEAVLAAQKELKIVPSKQNRHPNKYAVSALFENKLFSNVPAKKTLECQMRDYVAKPLPIDYSKYDWIILFNDSTRRSFNQLTNALETCGAARPVKGRIIMLGHYHSNPDVKGIESPGGGADEAKMKPAWNKMTALVKASFKFFLEMEFGWQKPGNS